MRIVFCGSGEVAAPALQALNASRHTVQAVYTQPPRPAGRGGRLRRTPCDEKARELGLPVIQTGDINASQHVDEIIQLVPGLIVVVDFGQKVGPQVREAAALGAINLHTSLLPELRGAAPVNWAILRGYTQTGVTTFFLVDRMDAGPILLQDSLIIHPEETAEELRCRLAELGSATLVRTVDALEAGQLVAVGQDETRATKAPKLSKADGHLDFAQDALTLANRIRGTWPWPGACADFCHADKPPVRVTLARSRQLPADGGKSLPPGTLDDELKVAVGDGRLEILQLKVAGKRLMSWKDFVNGYRLQGGDRFAAVAVE